MPTRHQLDEIVRDRPVALSDAGHHTLWVNSRALELAGVDRHTPQPHNGHIHVDADGVPIGYLNETAAEIVGRVIPPATDDEMYAGLLNAQEYLWSFGVSGWHEAILGDYNGKADCTPAYLRGIASSTLKSDTSGALWIAPGLRREDVPALVARFVELRERNAAAGLDTSTAKAMIDGVPHGETAALLEPYCNHSADGFTGELALRRGGDPRVRPAARRGRVRTAPAHHGRSRHSGRAGCDRSGAGGERRRAAAPHRASVDGASPTTPRGSDHWG
ncbi:amidohydrolase family protein [Microbacterium elymi]|uniref:Amidohydrolase family protein n=1 Tax=Microbacterium elymi TaxID=2909587 RepID=A0ABY5NLC3_9MICO|nr:amidohydrolase family protein [Microbacterium elymi]UUT35975.1 amidohydrolase family protein [Microbacterium elymi]